MSIVLVCRLDASELTQLGNNIRPAAECRNCERRRQIQAVDRSMAALGEQVQSL